MPHESARIAVGVSGGGRSLENLLAVAKTGGVRFEVGAVIASRPDCRAVSLAEEAGVPVFVGSFTRGTLADTTARLYPWLEEQRIGWIALAGFLKLFPLDPAWSGRIVNIHPALLPAHGGHGMYGDRVHAAVLAAGDATSGATVHYVDERYDEGAAIAQIEVPVRAGDDAHALAARVFAAECILYPHALDGLVTGRLPRAAGVVERLTYAP